MRRGWLATLDRPHDGIPVLINLRFHVAGRVCHTTPFVGWQSWVAECDPPLAYRVHQKEDRLWGFKQDRRMIAVNQTAGRVLPRMYLLKTEARVLTKDVRNDAVGPIGDPVGCGLPGRTFHALKVNDSGLKSMILA